MQPVYTIGHSAMDQDEFLARCKSSGITRLVDIRSHPVSRWEHYNLEELSGTGSWLAEAGIEYRWDRRLGGWSGDGLDRELTVHSGTRMPLRRTNRPGTATVQHVTVGDWAQSRGIRVDLYAGDHFPRHHAGGQPSGEDSARWQTQGQADYAWYTSLPMFGSAVNELITQAVYAPPGSVTALMCTEFVWWKCHRSQVSDVLCWLGVPVVHIQPAHVRHSDMLGRRLRNYPDQVKESWGSRRKLRRVTAQ